MVNKIHIYGCSHSTEHKVDYTEFWGYLLMKKLNLKKGRLNGLSGMGYPHIFSLIVDDIFKNNISKNDVVILNTSYQNRYTVPFITIGESERRTIKTDWRPPLNEESHLISPNIERPSVTRESDVPESSILFDESEIIIDWYNKTRLAYKLLSEVCDNVFQWTLSPVSDIDFIYEYLLTNNELSPYEIKYPSSAHRTHLLDKIKHGDIDRLMPLVKNKWDNLILPDSKYTCWHEFILDNDISKLDRHMNKNGHYLMYLQLYNKIKTVINE